MNTERNRNFVCSFDRGLAALVATALALALLPFTPAWAWVPEKPVEIVVSSAPGGSNDRVARLIQ